MLGNSFLKILNIETRSDPMENQQRLKNNIQKFLFNHGCEKTYFHCEKVGDYAYTLGKEYLDIPEKAGGLFT